MSALHRRPDCCQQHLHLTAASRNDVGRLLNELSVRRFLVAELQGRIECRAELRGALSETLPGFAVTFGELLISSDRDVVEATPLDCPTLQPGRGSRGEYFERELVVDPLGGTHDLRLLRRGGTSSGRRGCRLATTQQRN